METVTKYQESVSFVDLLGDPVVFLHDINTLPNFMKIILQVDGIDKYERALSIARPDDVVITKYHPEKSYLQWLQEIGLGSKKLIVLNGTTADSLPERVINYHTKDFLGTTLGTKMNNAVISPYYGGPLEHQASIYLGLEMYAKPNLVMKYDSKIIFKALCQKIGVPVINASMCTITPSLKDLVNAIKFNLTETGKVIVKGEFGASASTTYVLDHLNMDLIREIDNYSQLGDRFLVEPFYESLSQPSSLWFISKDKEITHLRTSNQLLDEETSHIGNEFPVEFDEKRVQELSFQIAKQLCLEGFIGHLGIDYVETKEEMFAAECNPRVTGATYPWELVHRLEKNCTINAARAQNIYLPKKGLQFKDLLKNWEEVLYDGQDAEGVIIPFNVGPISEGKVTVLATGSSKNDVEKLFEFIKFKTRKLN